MKVRIDLHRCIGAGTCIVLAPTAFGWRPNDDKAMILDPTTVEAEVVRAAWLACPTQAIEIEEDGAEFGPPPAET